MQYLDSLDYPENENENENQDPITLTSEKISSILQDDDPLWKRLQAILTNLPHTDLNQEIVCAIIQQLLNKWDHESLNIQNLKGIPWDITIESDTQELGRNYKELFIWELEEIINNEDSWIALDLPDILLQLREL